MTSLDFFHTSDFVGKLLSLDINFSQAEALAKIANAKLEKALGPKVYGEQSLRGELWSTNEFIDGKHTAFLFDIQEIKKPECTKHEPDLSEGCQECGEPGLDLIKCIHCGVELVATWSVVE